MEEEVKGNLNKQEILKEISDQIKLGLYYILPKREIFRDNISKYVDQNKDDEKIWVNTLYASTQLYTAIKYSDELAVIAKPRKFWDEEYADNITNLAEFDYKEMWLNRIKHSQYIDECLFWYSIKTKEWWDDIRKVVEVTIRDPISRIPDPYSDYITEWRWNYFETETTLHELKEMKWFNEYEVDNAIMEESQATITARNEAQWTNDVLDNTLNKIVSIYTWYTKIKGKLYSVAVDSKFQSLLKFEEIKPVTKEEKKEWEVSMKTCVNISRFSPISGNACGISMADLILDKQRAQSILLNLRLIDAKFNTFGQINLVNTNIIKDTWELTKPSINTKWIWVNAWEWQLWNAVYPVPRQSIMADSFNVSQEITRQIQLDTGIDSRSLWVQGDKNITLWESQQIQANANVIFGLWVEVSWWAEEDFWKFIWFRSYQEFFASSDSKFIRISNGFNTNQTKFRRDDFLWTEDIDFSIESKKKSNQLREQMKVQFAAILPMILSDPNVPKITKSVAFKYQLKLQWHWREMQQILNPYFSQEEIDARRKVLLLDNNNILWANIDSFDVELMTYYIIFQSAMDTPAKEEALRRLEDAMIYAGQNKPQQENWVLWWMANAAAAQLTSSAIQQNSTPKQSLQTV